MCSRKLRAESTAKAQIQVRLKTGSTLVRWTVEPPNTTCTNLAKRLSYSALHDTQLLLLAFLISADAVAAQQLDSHELVPGAPVRVEVEGRAAIGGIHNISRDTLVVTLWEQPGSWTVPTTSITKLQISSGSESRLSSAARWGWRSALIFGGLMVATLGPVCGSAPEGECEGFGAFLSQSAVSGAILGGLYGTFAPRERWITIPLSSSTPQLR